MSYPLEIGPEYSLTLNQNVAVTLRCGPRCFGYGQSLYPPNCTEETYEQYNLANLDATKYALSMVRYKNGTGPGFDNTTWLNTDWIVTSANAGSDALGPLTPTETGRWALFFAAYFADVSPFNWTSTQDAIVVPASGSDIAIGDVIAMKQFESPGVVHIIYQTSSGQILARQNPY